MPDSVVHTWHTKEGAREEPAVQVDIAIPEVFIGGLLGATLVFLFSAWACVAVGRSAQAVVTEVGFPCMPAQHLYRGSSIACLA